MFQHPILQQYEFPKSPKDIAKAIRLANEVNPANRDVRYLMALLSRMELVHSAIPRHVVRRKSLIAGAEFDIIASDDKYSELAKMAKLRLEDIILELFDTYLNGTFYGASLTKLNYELTELGYVPEIDFHYDPVEIERYKGVLNNIVILTEDANSSFVRSEINEIERHYFISYTDNKKEVGGIFRSLIYDVFLLNMSKQEWALFLQFLKGLIQGKIKTGASPEDKNAATQAVQSAVDHKFTVTTDMVDFDFHELAQKDSGSSFSDFLQMCREEIEIAITGTSALATDRVRNAPTVQEKSEEDLAKWGRKDFSKMINKQLLKHDYFMNVDKSTWGLNPPYKFVFKSNLVGDRQKNHDMSMDLVDRGIPLAVNEYEQKTGIKLAREGDILMQSTPQFSQNPATPLV